MRPTKWRRSTHVVIGVAVVLLVAAVVVAAALLTGGHVERRRRDPAGPRSCHRRPGDQAGVGLGATSPTPDKLAATLALTLADPNLGAFTGRITDATTGEQLWAQGADVPMQPASANKVLTTAAALLALDRDARLTTTVLASDRRPGVVVLKGGGDPTLSAAPARAGHLVPRRGPDQRPGRSGAAQRHQGDRRAGRTSAPSAGRRWRPAGIRSTSTAATSRRWSR